MANDLRREPLHYSGGGVACIGQMVWNAGIDAPRPGVLVAPAFGGLGPLEIAQAEALAREGYVALAVDYYGDGTRVETQPEAFKLMQAVQADRPVLGQRMASALAALAGQPAVQGDRIGALGYCFGGKAVLDLARMGADIRAAIPIHGVYDPPPDPTQKIQAAVLVLHGWDDPLATPADLSALIDELDGHCDDWQVLSFGKTGHAFTNPGAQSHDAGMGYSKSATRRSQAALLDFLNETLRV